MAARLRARLEAPESIVTSPAKRAFKTAKIVADGWGYPRSALRIEARLYLATPEEMLAVIGEQDDASASLLVVGHNPGITELANRLLPDLALDNLPTAGVLVLDMGAARWADLPTAPAELVHFDYPKKAGVA